MQHLNIHGKLIKTGLLALLKDCPNAWVFDPDLLTKAVMLLVNSLKKKKKITHNCSEQLYKW